MSSTDGVRVSHSIAMRALVQDRRRAHEGGGGLRDTKATNVGASLKGFRRQSHRQGCSIVIAEDRDDMPVVASHLSGISGVEHR